MEVTVNLMSIFEKYRAKLKNGKAVLEEGTTIMDLAKSLDLPTEYLRIMLLNGKQVDIHAVLHDGDTLYIFPPAIGGG